jgi:ABC-type lipoprotein export system ATPase subunit
MSRLAPWTGAPPRKCSAFLAELHSQGITLVVVTHDLEVARAAQRLIHVADGRLLP